MDIDKKQIQGETEHGQDVVTLQSNNGENFTLSYLAAQQSQTLKDLIGDYGAENIIPLPNVNQATLNYIVIMLRKLEALAQKSRLDEYLYIPSAFQPIVNHMLQDATQGQIIDLLKSADYLDISFIINAATAALADRIPKKSIPQVIKFLKTITHHEDQNDTALCALQDMKLDLANVGLGPLEYLVRHLTLRQLGITKEYSIADYIHEQGQPKIALIKQGLFYNTPRDSLDLDNKKLTSLFGINQIEDRKIIIRMSLTNNCFFYLALDPQNVQHPFNDFQNLTELDLSHNQLEFLKPGFFTGLTNLKQLSLAYNKLETLRNGSFNGIPNLIILFLNDNLLKNAEPGVFSVFKLILISKDGNDWRGSESSRIVKEAFGQ